MARKLLETINVNINILSPIHIGTGEYVDATEYLEEPGSIKFYSADQVNEGVIDIKRFNSMHNDAVSNRKESLPSLAKMVENGIVKLDEPYRTTIKGHPFACENKEIYTTLKSLNTPLLPGSTLKGIIRTALLFREIKSMGFDGLERLFANYRKTRNITFDEFVFGFMEERQGYPGKAIDRDLFRYVIVNDACFENQTGIYQEKMYSKSVGGKWKLNVLEAIRPGSSSDTTIRVDRNYMYNGKLSKKSKEYLDKMQSKEFIFRILYDYAEYILAIESDFYSVRKYNQACNGLLAQVKKLQQENTPMTPVICAGKNSDYLWHTISGYIKNEMPDYFKKNKDIFIMPANLDKAKEIGRFFPATRRYTETGNTAAGFGYAKLT